MRVAFLGNARWSVPSLEALAGSRHDAALVVTRVPRPGRRGGRAVPTPVADAAVALKLSLREVETVRSGPGLDALREASPEVLVVVAYGEILPAAVLDIPTAAPVNVHFSLLPELRGAAPVQRAIMEGLDVTGVTTIRMDEGLDTGPILLQEEVAIQPKDDAGSLGDRLASVGGWLLVSTLDRLEEGTLPGRAQDGDRATWAPKITPEDRVIDWSEPAEAIHRRVRAMSPEPGAETRFRGRTLKVFRTDPIESPSTDSAPPGAVAESGEGLLVGSGDGLVELVEIAPEGRRRMSGADFLRGFRPAGGETLG
jgi:methionyl-tRNA formyltransferase